MAAATPRFHEEYAPDPNHYGETNLFVLPHSQLPVMIASKYHVTAGPGDRRAHKTPDVAIPFTHADFARGRDAAMDWVRTLELPE